MAMTKKLLPHSRETEEGLVGALLLDTSQLLPIADVVGQQGEAFHVETLRWIFRAIRAVYLRQVDVDPVTVAAELEKHDKLKQIGGASELTRLLTECPSLFHAPSYAHIVAHHYEARQVIIALQRSVQAAYDPKTQSALEVARGELAKVRPAQFPTEDLTRRTSWTLAELLATDFPEPEWIVEGLLPRGALVVLGGKQKIGKSWLCLQLAQAVASGAPFLRMGTQQGPVLYLALEDGAKRLNDRLRKQHAQSNGDLHFRLEFPSLDDPAGIDRLALEAHQVGAILTIVDTLASAKTGQLDENDAGQMAGICNPLRQLAQVNECAILVVHHHAKGALGDPGTDLRGSSALAAAADANLGLYKKRGEVKATLKLESRDLPEHDLALEFDPVDTFAWHLLGDARQIAANDAEQEALGALEALGAAHAGEVAKELGKSRPAARRVLERLVSKGQVTRDQVNRRGTRVIIYKIPEGAP